MKTEDWQHLSDHDRILLLLSRMEKNEELMAGFSDVLTISASLLATSETRLELLSALTERVLEIPPDSLRTQGYWQMIGLLRGLSDAEADEPPHR